MYAVPARAAAASGLRGIAAYAASEAVDEVSGAPVSLLLAGRGLLRRPSTTLAAQQGGASAPKSAFQPGTRTSDKLLLSKDKFAKNASMITEARRAISKSGIAAERLKFPGKNAVKVGPGKWRSIDGTRQFRVKPNDYRGQHGNIGPHVHFEFLRPNSAGTKLELWKYIHVPLR